MGLLTTDFFMQQGGLHGLRAIEMDQLIADPFCCQLMGDHGADVI